MTTRRIRADLVQLSDSPPTVFRIWRFGVVDTSKGKFLFDKPTARKLFADYSSQGNEIAIDYEHRMVDPDARAGDGKAAGWCKLEIRDDGLWAVSVRWTPQAHDGLQAREWRYFSPAFEVDEDNRITSLINIALTNIPATKCMDPLMAASKAARRRTRKETAMPCKTKKMTETEEWKRLEDEAEEAKKTEELEDAQSMATKKIEELEELEDAPEGVETEDESVTSRKMLDELDELVKKMRKRLDDMEDGESKDPDGKDARDELESEDLDDAPEPVGTPKMAKTSKTSKTAQLLSAVRSVTGETDESRAIGALYALKVAADRAGETALANAKLQKTVKASKIDDAVKSGRLPPAMRKIALSWSDDTLTTYLSKVPSLIRTHATALEHPPVPSQAEAVVPDDGSEQVKLDDGRVVVLTASELKAARGLDLKRVALAKINPSPIKYLGR